MGEVGRGPLPKRIRFIRLEPNKRQNWPWNVLRGVITTLGNGLTTIKLRRESLQATSRANRTPTREGAQAATRFVACDIVFLYTC